MRLVATAAALALAGTLPGASATAVAQAPVTTQPLAPGEVLLEVNALGLVTTRADRATLSFGVSGSGATEAEARAAAERSIGEVRAMLRGQSVADADIRISPLSTLGATDAEQEAMANALDAMNAAAADMADMNASTASPMENPISARATVEVVVRTVDRAAAVQSELMQRGMFAMPTYALADDAIPRREARAQALRRARADADAYAAALNMRVNRIVRVTERLGLDMLGMMVTENQVISRLLQPTPRSTGPDVQTTVVVGVDYALAPR